MMNNEPKLTSRSEERIFANEFFYSNLRIQESLTAIRYGIEARRGLIIITGAPGSGKTALLSKAVAGLPPHVFCLAVSGESLQFADVLRRIANEQTSGGDEASLVRNCQALLRTRLARNELTALAIDDAHLLPERTLRNLIHNFSQGSAESAEGALLQLILAGNQSLKQKLSHAALIPLRRRRPVVCKVAPLSSQEIGMYIEEGLRSADRPGDLFDTRAVKRVALLSQGNPGAIERLCERALRLNGGSGVVIAEKVDAAAHALNLRVGAQGETVQPSDRDFTLLGDESEPRARQTNAPASLPRAGNSFDFRRRDRGIFDWIPRGPRITAWLRVVTFVTAIVALAALVPAQLVTEFFAGWREKLTELALDNRGDKGVTEAPPGTVKSPAIESPPPAPPQSGPSSAVRVPGPDSPVELKAEESRGPDLAPAERSSQRKPPEATERKGASENKPYTPARRNPPKETPTANRDLQLEVARAIASRAIMGVEVSVVQGTAILDGRVATERQRRAAERAALSVAGVERVRNRIAITMG